MWRPLPGVPLHLGQVVERISPDQFTGMDQAHEQIASFGAVQRAIKQSVLAMEHGTFQRAFADIMPRAGLCRVRGARRLLLGRIANISCAKYRHNHRPSRKESNGSAGLKRSGARPEEVVWASARSLICMSACR